MCNHAHPSGQWCDICNPRPDPHAAAVAMQDAELAALTALLASRDAENIRLRATCQALEDECARLRAVFG